MMVENKDRIVNRISGLLMVVFGGISMSTDMPLLDVAGTMFLAEGVGDLISGRHHYISTGIIRYLSRGKLDIRYRGDPKYEGSVHDK